MMRKIAVALRLTIEFCRKAQASDNMVREQYRILSRQLPTMYVLLLVNGVFLSLSVMGSVDWRHAVALPMIPFIAVCFRGVLWLRRLTKSKRPTVEKMRAKLRGTLIGAAVLPAAFSLWLIVLLFESSPMERAFLPLSNALTMITCAYCLLCVPIAALEIILIGTVPFALALIATNDMALSAAGINLLVVAALSARMVLTQYAQLSRIVDSRQQIAEERAVIDKLAYTDVLTGLPNRRAFLSETQSPIRPEAGSGVAIVMIDLDGFKPINDTYGHATGDGLLIEAARRLSDSLPPSSMVARLGGDEFAVLLRNMANGTAAEIATEAMMASFAAPFSVGSQTFRVGASFGLAFDNTAATSFDDLLHRADMALYRAKLRATRKLCVFAPWMEDKVRRRTLIEQALADHEQAQRIRLSFQPIFDAGSLSVLGFEALARWDHPDFGVIDPSEFVTVAEQTGMSNILTERLFRKALEVATRWPEDQCLSFNLSAAELGSPRLPTILISLADEYGFDLKRLAVEVTETALMNDIPAAREALARLTARGAQVWLDDFGAGFASIGYLREMRFDAIKLDGALVGSIVESEQARALLAGVLYLCQAINTPVIAEMVETADQLALLRTMPIAKLQGFHLARPLPAEATLDTTIPRIMLA